MSIQPATGRGNSPFQPSAIVAKYWALVSGDLIASDLSLQSGAEGARGRLASQAPWAPSWPPRPVPDAAALTRFPTQAIALVRLKALFDFGAQLPDSGVGDIRRHTRARWPQVERPGTAFERIMVTAVVRANGDAEWGYERTGDPGEALPIEAAAPEGARPELDLFLQNVARADVESRLLRYS